MQIAQTESFKNVPYNFAVNVADAAFFGMALGLTSSVTILPLFLSHFTDSTALIGLISSIHLIGWHLPQLLTVRRVARQSRYKPLTLRMTLQERWPFLGLAAVALLVPAIPDWLVVALVFLFYSWHSLGAGFTATAWQSMIARIMPRSWHGRFFGIQSAGFSLLSGLGAIIAGSLLTDIAFPVNFALCFLIASVMMAISFGFLASTREPEGQPKTLEKQDASFWRGLADILRRDHSFRWYLVARTVAQFAVIGLNFYTIYSVRRFDLQPDVLGFMTGVMLLGQTLAHPLGGWLGDRFGHRWTFGLGALALGLANLTAAAAPGAEWMYVVFALAGMGSAAFTTSILALNLTFGIEAERPFYIGLGNTLVAPFTIIAPLVGGLLVDGVSFSAMFIMTMIASALTAFILMTFARAPKLATT